jgi:hypothetical protein
MGNKYLITYLILSISTITTFGQGLNPINHIVRQLKKKGADTILVYISGCDGCQITNRRANCTCLDMKAITAVFLIFKLKGQFYKEEFTCCNETSLIKMDSSSSVPYFLVLKDILKRRDAYYKDMAKHVKFFPPIATDNPYEEIDLIVPHHNYEIVLSSYQRNEGYDVWKKYFWIDNEIKLMDLVRKDIGIYVTQTPIPIH